MSVTSSMLEKFDFPIEVAPNSLQTQKRLGISFQDAVFIEFLINLLLL